MTERLESAEKPLDLPRIVASARRLAEMEEAFGAEEVPFDRGRVARQAAKYREAIRLGRLKAAAQGPAGAKAAALAALEAELQPCCKCGLGATRTKLVFGVGHPDADLMFIGEAPGHDEDAQGVPFVGAAGQLLTRIIAAIGLKRDEVYIANVCKCRPPGNRTPSPEEAAACLPYLLRQIEIIQPRLIVTLGNPATQAILSTTIGITRMRGRFTVWNGIEVMPTFHPAYLLRNPDAKRPVWEDMQKVHARMKELGLRIGELKTRR